MNVDSPIGPQSGRMNSNPLSQPAARKSALTLGRLPCWLRMVLSLAAAGWLSLSAFSAGAETALPQPTAAEAEALEARFGVQVEDRKPIDRAFVTETVGEPRGEALSGAALETLTHEVASLLRCPVCQGSAVADSPSNTAINMKNEVRDLLAAGYDEQQVLDWFEAAYGQFVLMAPKAEGINLLVWIVPVLLVAGGLTGIALSLRKKGDAVVTEEVPSRGQLPEDEALIPWVRKVRELAYGWPGGEPPEGVS